MSDLAFRPAWQLAEAIRNGELSPVVLVQSCLDRIDALNPSVNAFVSLRRDEALAEATALQRLIVAGKRLGPLAGLPVGVKGRAARMRARMAPSPTTGVLAPRFWSARTSDSASWPARNSS